jgi:hypothetical protein
LRQDFEQQATRGDGMAGARWAALAFGVAALAGWAGPKLPEGEYMGLVAKRETVALRGAGEEAGVGRAYAWTVKLDGGRRMTVVQSAPMFAIGERVKVVTEGGRTQMQIP